MRFRSLAERIERCIASEPLKSRAVHTVPDLEKRLASRCRTRLNVIQTPLGPPRIAQFRFGDGAIRFSVEAGPASKEFSIPYEYTSSFLNHHLYGPHLLAAELETDEPMGSTGSEPLTIAQVEERVRAAGAPWGLKDWWGNPVRVVVAPDQEQRAHVLLFGSGPDNEAETVDDPLFAYRRLSDRVLLVERTSPSLLRMNLGIAAGSVSDGNGWPLCTPDMGDFPHEFGHAGIPELTIQTDGGFAITRKDPGELRVNLTGGASDSYAYVRPLKLPFTFGAIYFAYFVASDPTWPRPMREFEMTERGVQIASPLMCATGSTGTFKLKTWKLKLRVKRGATSGGRLSFSVRKSRRPAAINLAKSRVQAELFDSVGSPVATFSNQDLALPIEPSRLSLEIPEETRPGEYTLRVCVELHDRAGDFQPASFGPQCKSRLISIKRPRYRPVRARSRGKT